MTDSKVLSNMTPIKHPKKSTMESSVRIEKGLRSSIRNLKHQLKNNSSLSFNGPNTPSEKAVLNRNITDSDFQLSSKVLSIFDPLTSATNLLLKPNLTNISRLASLWFCSEVQDQLETEKQFLYHVVVVSPFLNITILGTNKFINSSQLLETIIFDSLGSSKSPDSIILSENIKNLDIVLDHEKDTFIIKRASKGFNFFTNKSQFSYKVSACHCENIMSESNLDHQTQFLDELEKMKSWVFNENDKQVMKMEYLESLSNLLNSKSNFM